MKRCVKCKHREKKYTNGLCKKCNRDYKDAEKNCIEFAKSNGGIGYLTVIVSSKDKGNNDNNRVSQPTDAIEENGDIINK